MKAIKGLSNARTRTAALTGLVVLAGVPLLSPATPAEAAAVSTTVQYLTIVRQFSDDGLAVDRGHTFNGEPIVSWPPHVDQHNTQWTLNFAGSAPTSGFSSLFTLQARHSGQCIDIAGAAVTGARLVQQPCDPTKQTQQWFYGPASDSGSDTYRHLHNRAAGLPGTAAARVMKVKDGGAAGTALVLAPKDSFGSTHFAMRAPFKVTTTTEIVG